MDQSFEDFVAQVRADPKTKKDARALADRLFVEWQQGIIPAPSTVALLRELTAPLPVCGRLGLDGTCVWLRQYGARTGLSLPPAGTPASCQFVAIYDRCPGYVEEPEVMDNAVE